MEIEDRQGRGVLEVSYIYELIVTKTDSVKLGGARYSTELTEAVLVQVQHDEVLQVAKTVIFDLVELVAGD